MNVVFRAGMEKFETRSDGSLKLSFGTPILSNDVSSKILDFSHKEALMHLTTGPVLESQKAELYEAAADLKDIKGKSHSQRLRAVLYRLHQQEDSMLSFSEYYSNRMELMINHIKERLE